MACVWREVVGMVRRRILLWGSAVTLGAGLAVACGSNDGRSPFEKLWQTLSTPRPNLTSERTPMAFTANGHTLSYDGRLYIGAHAADASGRLRGGPTLGHR